MVRPHSELRRKGKADPGCPYCSGRKVLAGYNDLAATHPVIAPMWHPRMNKRLKPTGVQAVSRKPAWWRGECSHVYQMAVRDGVRARPGCCPVLFGEEEARGADKARLALGLRRGGNGGGVGASCLISQMRGVVNARVDKACISSMQIARFGTSLADAWVELDSAIKLAAVTKHARSILHCDRARLFISSLTGRLGYSD